jgi:hypothetical protein
MCASSSIERAGVALMILTRISEVSGPHIDQATYLLSYGAGIRAGRPRGQSSSPGRVKNFLFSASSRPALGFTKPPTQMGPGGKAAGA